MTYRLNLAFHKIVSSESQIDSRYTVEERFFKSVIEALRSLASKQLQIRQICIFFDDNHSSCFHIAAPDVAGTPFKGAVAVPIESIGQQGFCSVEELRSLHQNGYDILPHGYSHAALATYVGNTLQGTPNGGLYRNMHGGKGTVLTEREVLFQLIESKKALQEFSPVDFVLPYGSYNEKTILINSAHGVYQRLVTCDPFLDADEILRPRLLITNELTVDQTMQSILTPMAAAHCSGGCASAQPPTTRRRLPGGPESCPKSPPRRSDSP